MSPWPGLVLRRLGAGVVVLLLVHAITFFALRLPGQDPFAGLAGDRMLPPEAIARLHALYGHDGSMAQQYFSELWLRLSGDFGISLRLAPGLSAGALLLAALPVSIGIGCGALLFGLVMGLPAGIAAARRPQGMIDRSVRTWSAVGLSVPDYVLGTAGLVVLALGFGLLPAGGLASPAGLILPVLTLGVGVAATIARLTRTALAEELDADFARTARAKGANEIRVAFDHALRPAFGPVLAYLAPAAAAVLTGSMAVERLFNLPGLGACFVQGALTQDWPVVTGAALLYTAILVTFNLAADLALAWLDPRTRA